MAQAKKKKRFWDVDMPLLKKQTHLYAIDQKELNGRIIKYDLTRILRGKNSLIQLRVKADDEEATSVPINLNLLPSYLKRIVRKGTDYVEDSLLLKCEDAEIKIKPLLVTRRRVSRAVRKALRDKTKEELTNYIKNKKVEDLFDDILKNQLQKSLSLKLKKIYPLSLCEIRVLKVVKELEIKPKEKKETQKDSDKKE